MPKDVDVMIEETTIPTMEDVMPEQPTKLAAMVISQIYEGVGICPFTLDDSATAVETLEQLRGFCKDVDGVDLFCILLDGSTKKPTKTTPASGRWAVVGWTKHQLVKQIADVGKVEEKVRSVRMKTRITFVVQARGMDFDEIRQNACTRCSEYLMGLKANLPSDIQDVEAFVLSRKKDVKVLKEKKAVKPIVEGVEDKGEGNAKEVVSKLVPKEDKEE